MPTTSALKSGNMYRLKTESDLTPDRLFIEIADYVLDYRIETPEAFITARLCLLDALGCGLLALNYPACTKLLGPIVPGAEVPNGVRIPGLPYRLEPVQAAFNIGAMIRWLDFNDTWLAAEWGHPSDNLGGILAVADYLSRRNIANGKAPLLIKDVLIAMIKAYEIQGIIGLENSFNRVGLDHVLLVRIATAAVVTALLGGGQQQIVNALSNAWIDGCALRCYRHAPNTGSRKSWAAGDATSRGVRLALMSMTGGNGLPLSTIRQKLGILRRLIPRQFLCIRPRIRQLRYGKHLIQNLVSSRIPCPDSRRSSSDTPPIGEIPLRRN